MSRIEPKFEMQSFQALFGPNNNYQVPSYQRGYAWGSEQVDQLLDDLHTAYTEDPENYYLLGQSIVCRNGSDWDIVDGQQRLTTLFILVTHARNVLEPHEDEFDRLHRSRYSGILSLVQRETDGELHPSLTAAKPGRAYIELLVEGKSLPDSDANPSQENIRTAHETFSDWFEKNFPNPTQKFEFLWFVLNKVLILRLELQDVQEALVVFQKMNNRGLVLDNADLLKNLLFIKADEGLFERLSKSWDQASQSIYGSRLKRAKSMEFLLKAMIGLETGQSVSTPNLFKEWQKKLENSDDVHKFATTLDDKAMMIARASHNRNFLNQEINETPGTFLFKWVQHLEILLAGMHLEESGYRHLCELVDDRAMLSMLAGEKNQDLERVLHKWAYKVNKLLPGADRGEILAASNDVLGNLSALLGDLRNEVPSLSYAVKTQREKLRYALARIAQEVEVQAKNVSHANELVVKLTKPTARGAKKFHIDHVFPQSERQRANWPNPDNQALIHSIGNLILLHPDDNQEKNDALPESDVARQVIGGSKLLINQSMRPLDTLGEKSPREIAVLNAIQLGEQPALESWGADQVLARQKTYLDLLVASFERSLT